jgi:hypothetical protein
MPKFKSFKVSLNLPYIGGIEGTWEVGGNSGTFWLTRPGTGNAGGTDPVTGTWSGEVQVAGDVIPFSLVLRLNGETVTGEVTSALGSVPLSSGSWKDGALLLGFPYVSGEPVSMGAQLQDGKLVGVVDYNKGEATGTWTAVRK